MIANIYFFLSFLATEVNGSSEFRQRSITVEPLLRFPFVHSLANPCGFLLPTAGVTVERDKLNHFESSDQQEITLAPLRNINKEIPLTKQVLDFLGPFHDLIQQSFKPPLSMNNTQINEQSTQELILVVSQALQLIFSIYSQSALRKCNGFQLQSLPPENVFIVSSMGEIQLEELYRSLMIIAAHLHLMIYDLYDSTRFCASENFAQLQIWRQLAGKLETAMCLILQSAIITSGYEISNYFKVTQKVLQTYVHRYFACSAREIQGCLVLRNAHRILNLIQRHVQPTQKASFPKTKRR